MSIDINVEKKEKYSIVKVSGKVDATTSGELENTLVDIIENQESKIVLDLNDVTYISSAGLRVLVVITKQLLNSGYFFCSISDNVKEIVQMAGFHTFMNIFDDIDAAIKAMEEAV